MKRILGSNDDTRLPDFTNYVVQLQNEVKTLEEITTGLNDWCGKVTSSEHNRKELISRFGNRGGYDREIDSYVLYNYEYSLMVKSLTGKMRLDLDCLTSRTNGHSNSGVEHIFPVRSRNEYWATKFSKFSDNEKRALKHSLGNLVLIQDEKNQKLANKGFDDKKGSKETSLGYKYGTFSEVELAQFDEWNAVNILHRGINLLNFIEKRWEIKIGNKRDKAAFLGLSFLLP